MEPQQNAQSVYSGEIGHTPAHKPQPSTQSHFSDTPLLRGILQLPVQEGRNNEEVLTTVLSFVKTSKLLSYLLQTLLVQERTLRRFIPHPWLLEMVLLCFVFNALISWAVPQSTAQYIIIAVVAGPFYLIPWIYSIVTTVQGKRWGWLIALLLCSVPVVVLFSILDRSKKQQV